MTDTSIMFCGQRLPAIGQGTWYMGEHASARRREVEALKAGISQGLTLIDTAEMYADGGAETIVGEAIRGQRDNVFLVSKVYPWNAGGQKMADACEASLRRLGTDYLDLYLLHWRGSFALKETVEAMQALVAEGKIRHWGVSNLDIDDMQALWQVEGGKVCATNQVLYHLASRGIEYDLMPWCQSHEVPMMAYCPLAQAGRLRDGLFAHPDVQAVASNHRATVAQVLLAWVIHHNGVMAIPKAATMAHVKENAEALALILTAEELQRLDKAFRAPGKKVALDVV